MNPSIGMMNRSISILFRYTQGKITRQLQERGMKIGNGQYPYLLAVSEHPGIRQDHLTGRLYYNKSSVARSIAALEKNGYLRRETDPADRRVYHIYPTQRGLAAIPMIRELLDAQVAQFTAGFTPQEISQLDELLRRAADNVLGCKQRADTTDSPNGKDSIT